VAAVGKVVIDAHAHIVPDIYAAAMREAGLADAAGNLVGDGFPFPNWSLQDSLEVMDRRDIAVSVLSITAPGVQFLSADKARPLARALNEQMAEIVHDHPAQFANMAVLPLPDIDASLREIDFAFGPAGFDGIGLYSNIGGRYLGHGCYKPIFEELDRRRATVFIHPAQPPSFDEYSLGLPAPILEYPFDSTRTLASLLYSGALARYSNIKLIVPHGGGAVPYLAPRIARTAASPMYGPHVTPPSEAMTLLKSIYYDLTAMGAAPNLALLREFIPADQLLVGYDYPFRPEETIASHIKAFEEFSGFSAGEKAKIRVGNALRLFPRLAAHVDAGSQHMAD
jgi:predicted TIM-barrel fold metal-dependent hydrolase